MLDSRRMARLGSDIATHPTGGFFHGAGSIGLDFCSLYVLIDNDRPTRELAHADPKQMEKLAAEAVRRRGPSAPVSIGVQDWL
jgi:hypothetical protein